MKTCLVDTNIFLRFFLKDIPSQFAQSKAFFELAKRGEIKIVVCQVIIFEIEFGLRKYYSFEKTEIVRALGTTLNMPYIEIEDRKIFQEALILYSNRNWDLVDCFLIAKTNQENTKLLSFDKKIRTH